MGFLISDDVGALAGEVALGKIVIGAICGGIGLGIGSETGRGALTGETALDEGATGALGTGTGFRVSSLSDRGALAGEAAYGKGASIVLFLGKYNSSSLSLFFPPFNPGDSSATYYCFFCENGGDGECGLDPAASFSSLFVIFPSFNPGDSFLVCFCLFYGSGDDGEGGLDDASGGLIGEGEDVVLISEAVEILLEG